MKLRDDDDAVIVAMQIILAIFGLAVLFIMLGTALKTLLLNIG